MTRFPALALSATALVLGLAACGGSSSSSTSAAPASSTSSSPATSTSASSSTSSAASSAPAAAGSTLTEAADPSGNLKFVKPSLTAQAGNVTIKFTNASMLPHNFTLQQGTAVVGATPTFSGGGTKTLSVKLKPGTYTFYCSVDGHRAAGMQGTLTVK